MRPNRSLMLLALVLVGCGAESSTDNATKAVADFRVQYYAKDFAGMYENADPEFQKATSRADWERLMRTMASRLGEVQNASDPAWHINVGTGGKYVRLDYETEFEKGAAKETFLWRIKGESARLMGYNINSLKLLGDETPSH